MSLQHSDAQTARTAQFEGFRSRAYQDSGGVWTNGFGNTHGVTSTTQPVTQDEALADLNINLRVCDVDVNRMTFGLNPTQNEFDALVDFVFNLGPGKLAGSTLLAELRAGNKAAAAAEFLKWDHAGGIAVSGLLARRKAESELFLQP